MTCIICNNITLQLSGYLCGAWEKQQYHLFIVVQLRVRTSAEQKNQSCNYLRTPSWSTRTNSHTLNNFRLNRLCFSINCMIFYTLKSSSMFFNFISMWSTGAFEIAVLLYSLLYWTTRCAKTATNVSVGIEDRKTNMLKTRRYYNVFPGSRDTERNNIMETSSKREFQCLHLKWLECSRLCCLTLSAVRLRWREQRHQNMSITEVCSD